MQKKIMALIIALLIGVSASITWVILQPQGPEPIETPPEDEPREIVEISLDELLTLVSSSILGNESAKEKLKELQNKTLITTGIVAEVIYDSSIFTGMNHVDDSSFSNSKGLIFSLKGNVSGTLDLYYLYVFPSEESVQTAESLNLKVGDKVIVQGILFHYAVDIELSMLISNSRLCDLVSSNMTKQNS